MLVDKALKLGDLVGRIYDFPVKGDTLDLHTHGKDDVHITIIARGRFRVFGPNFDQEVETGTVMDWDPGVYHAFESLDDNGRIVNIVKNYVKSS